MKSQFQVVMTVLLLAIPGQLLAQEPAPIVEPVAPATGAVPAVAPPVSPTWSPLPSLEAGQPSPVVAPVTPAPSPAGSREVWTSGNYGMAIFLGDLGLAAGGIVGGLAGLAIGETTCSSHSFDDDDDDDDGGADMDCLGNALAGAILGAALLGTLGDALAVDLYAQASSGQEDGSFFATWGGVLVGEALAIGLTLVALQVDDHLGTMVSMLGAGVLPSLGAVTGYRLSGRGGWAAASPQVAWAPRAIVGYTPATGLTFGLPALAVSRDGQAPTWTLSLASGSF
jgi:hypothetical protein